MAGNGLFMTDLAGNDWLWTPWQLPRKTYDRAPNLTPTFMEHMETQQNIATTAPENMEWYMSAPTVPCPRGPWPVWENRGGLFTQIHFQMCSYHANLFSKMCMSFIFSYDYAFVRIFFANVRLFFCYLYGLELVATTFRPDKS